LSSERKPRADFGSSAVSPSSSLVAGLPEMQIFATAAEIRGATPITTNGRVKPPSYILGRIQNKCNNFI
jgi:hypothetical protein